MPEWSEEARVAAKELFDSGMAATEAAAEFSQRFRPITRNVMCGIWFRMGLSRHDPRAKLARATRESSALRRKSQADSDRGLTQRIQKLARATPAHRQDDRSSDLVSLPEAIAVHCPESTPGKCGCDIFGLTNKTCRWPVGEPATPEFFFCGIAEANLKAGVPYCPQHERMARRCA
jgi:GcrA cell cycle regulator